VLGKANFAIVKEGPLSTLVGTDWKTVLDLTVVKPIEEVAKAVFCTKPIAKSLDVSVYTGLETHVIDWPTDKPVAPPAHATDTRVSVTVILPTSAALPLFVTWYV